MEPAFYRGDLLFLTNPPSSAFKTGDITVYQIPGVDIPIVHRVIETHDVAREWVITHSSLIALHLYALLLVCHRYPTFFFLKINIPMLMHHLRSRLSNTTHIHINQKLLTKGDNNYMDDIQLYQGLDWLERKHIVGKVQGYVSSSMHDIMIRIVSDATISDFSPILAMSQSLW